MQISHLWDTAGGRGGTGSAEYQKGKRGAAKIKLHGCVCTQGLHRQY